MQATADVVIIGAGVIGCSTAYHLARMGVTDVVVVEMEHIGSGSSSKSASMLSLQVRPDAPCLRMAQYSYGRYMAFEEELGAPIDFRKTGWLSLATAENAAHLRDNALLLNDLGVNTEILEPEEVGRRYPAINIDDVVLATWGPDDGTIDPHMIMSGYSKRARQMGGQICEGVRATGISVGNTQVEGVVTTDGFVSCGVVVNAAGPWAGEVGRWVNLDAPIINAARTIVVTGPFPDIPSDWPFVEEAVVEWYCRREGPGILMGMGVVTTEEAEVPFMTEMVDGIIAAAEQRVPVLAEANMQTGWTGIRPLTPDDRPILGTVSGLDGYVLNCGWGGMGIIQSPAAGLLAAECVVNGRATTFDVSPFAVERFQHRQEA
jgi:sarcosine oxidase subunit beta